MPKITKTFVDSVGDVKGDSLFWDDKIAGFGLRVRPTGRKTFIVQYRNIQGRTRKITVGQYGRLTPNEARKEAVQLLAAVDRGEDPAEMRRAGRQGITVAELADRYMQEHALVKKKASSAAQDRLNLDKYILPAMGSLKADAVTVNDVAQFHHSMQKRPIQGNRALALLSKMFNLAESWGIREAYSNPCRFIEKYKEIKRERFLSEEELARLDKVLANAEKDRSVHFSVITAVRLLLHTGCRKNEILTLKWEYVDLAHAIISLPDSKTGARLIPISSKLKEILLSTPRQAGSPFVCPGTKPGGHFIGLQKCWERLRKMAKLEDVRLHDLRHTFASVGAGSGMGLPIVGALLGHSKPSTTNRYAHLADGPLKEAVERISQQIDTAMKKEVPEKKKNGNVLKFKRKG